MAAIGCWLSGHPLDRFIDIESAISTQTTADLAALKRNYSAVLVGVITKIHKLKTKRGNDMTFFTLSDRRGLTEVVVPEGMYAKLKSKISKGTCVLVRGTMDRDGTEGKLRVHAIEPLHEKRRSVIRLLQLTLHAKDLDDETLQQIKNTLEDYRVTRAQVEREGAETDEDETVLVMYPKLRIHVPTSPTSTMICTLPGDPHFEISQGLFDKLERLLGRADALRAPG